VQDLSRATDAGTSRFSRNEVQDLSHAADAGTTKFNRMPSTSWKHMTFNPAANGGLKATIDSPVSSVSPISANATVDPYGLNVKSEQEKSREERLAQTRDGRFVGFKTPAETDALAPPTPVPNYKPFVFVDDENPPMPRKTVRESPTVESRWDSSDRYELRTGSSPYGKNRERHRKRSNFVSEHEEDEDDRMEERMQRKKERSARKKAGPPTPIILPEYISIANLATALKVRVEDFGAKMHELGFEETNHDYILDAETAGLIASEFNYQPVTAPNESIDLHARPPAQDKALLPSRPPVVTIMGHVDHGKTTLLDWLRKSSVAASEHGGITQHIGAFSVSMPSGRLITFLDTPGHAAFLSMRQRGANVTDIVILVVAADDSVKPQTLEALKHSQAAKVPIIVAVNKVDKEDANVDRVKQDLARYGVEIEDFGGDTQVVAVSGKTGQGMEELEDAVVALADVLDMRAETDGAAEGWVLEATTKKAGRVATVLVSRGTIRPGDVIVAGTTWARVRTLRNEGGAPVLAAGPGTPVEIDGWREQPSAGDEVLQASNEQQAKSVVAYRTVAAERDRMATDVAALNEARRLAQQKREQEEQKEVEKESVQEAAPTATSEPGIKEVFFIIKADVSGSVEAVVNSISALGNSEVRPHILRSGVGPVTEFDIEHAMTAKGHILSFNTVIDPSMNRMAEAAGVQIIDQSIIYRLVDDVKAKLSEYLTPIITQKVLGEAEISQIFDINIKRRVKIPIAGCKVRNGVITRKGKVRVLRGQEVIYEGMFSLPACPYLHSFLKKKKKLLASPPPLELTTSFRSQTKSSQPTNHHHYQ
jgi:translation initiation factor IF-2